jgi:hypothetical protein
MFLQPITDFEWTIETLVMIRKQMQHLYASGKHVITKVCEIRLFTLRTADMFMKERYQMAKGMHDPSKYKKLQIIIKE